MKKTLRSIVTQGFRRGVALAIPAITVVGFTGMAYGAVQYFQPGELLSASKLNASLKDLDDRVARVESGKSIPPGSVMAFAGRVEDVPVGWVLCDGAQLDGNDAEYAALYAAIGTAHGGNSATKTFNVPDYRGRFLRGVDGDSDRDPDRLSRIAMALGGNTGAAVGTIQGDAFSSHNHGGGSHNHPIPASPCHHTDYVYTGLPLTGNGTRGGNCGNDYASTDGPAQTVVNTEGGSETRPENAAVNFLVKL